MGLANASSWGYFQSGNDKLAEIDRLGRELNLAIGCSCHFPAFGKNLFECRCGVLFPRFVVEAAMESGDWSKVVEHHETGYRPDANEVRSLLR